MVLYDTAFIAFIAVIAFMAFMATIAFNYAIRYSTKAD